MLKKNNKKSKVMFHQQVSNQHIPLWGNCVCLKTGSVMEWQVAVMGTLTGIVTQQ
jgi:hypothetical protein